MDSKTLKMPLTSSCKWVFLIFPPLHSAPNPPMSQYFSFSPCSLSTFHLHTPSTTFSLSLLVHVSLVYLCSPLIGLSTSPILLTLGTLSCCQPFHRTEQIWWSILSLLCSTLTHSHIPQNCHRAQKSAQPSCLPTNYHTTSPTLPPLLHLCASSIYSRPLPSPITLYTHSAFITFNYPLCQRSPSYRVSALDCLTPPTFYQSPSSNLLFSNMSVIIAWLSFFLSFLKNKFFLIFSNPSLPGTLDVFHSALINSSLIWTPIFLEHVSAM